MALLSTASIGCGKNRAVWQWDQDVFAAGRLQDQGELDRAEREYRELIKSAPSNDARRFIKMELAKISTLRENWPEAIARFKEVYEERIDDEPGALALYRTGLITLEHFEDEPRALDIRRETITRFPKSVAAEFSVQDHARYYQARDEDDAMVQDFLELLEQVRDEPVAANLLYFLAVVFKERGEDLKAVQYYQRVWVEYPEENLSETAMWEAAQLFEEYQNWSKALPLYRVLAGLVEKSWFMGTYNSPWANDARLRLALINMLYLDDYSAAKYHFERYNDDFPDSIYSDDIAWDLVHIERLTKGEQAFKEAMEDFAEAFPESRYVRQVNRRLGREVAE